MLKWRATIETSSTSWCGFDDCIRTTFSKLNPIRLWFYSSCWLLKKDNIVRQIYYRSNKQCISWMPLSIIPSLLTSEEDDNLSKWVFTNSGARHDPRVVSAAWLDQRPLCSLLSPQLNWHDKKPKKFPRCKKSLLALKQFHVHSARSLD